MGALRLVMLLAAMLPGAAMPAGAAPGAQCKRVIVSADPDDPPYSWYENARFHGSAVDIAVLALERIRLPYEIRHAGTLPRVLDAATTGAVDLVVDLEDTPERRQYLAYSTVSMFTSPIAVFTGAGKKLDYKDWESLVGLKGGITVNNSFGAGLGDFAASRLVLQPADSIGLNFTRLSSGQIDYFIHSYYPALAYLVRHKLDKEFQLIQPFAATSDNFAAWSRRSPCLGKLREFDAALSAMARSGEVRRILETHLDPVRRQRDRRNGWIAPAGRASRQP
ncbi:MAG: substrate-binding periplasmic protein [Telluria sp.]